MYTVYSPPRLSILRLRAIITLAFVWVIAQQGFATTRTSVATGNWSSPGTWSPAGEPASGDIVIIHGGNVITVDSIFTCSNLTIGDATATNTTVQITSAASSLTISGAVSVNPNHLTK